ncbi:MAG: T9SS type A sorting domain-containing protein [Flavobacteriales bacterium]|nr:T9SS type A sorting domain-containing protein [Flavobacteriales bacterium]MBT6745079.1 T9SS type A sorting domain-containing protein [Flavobacteriales bacterium]
MKKGIISASILTIILVALAVLNPFINTINKKTGFSLPDGMSNAEARQAWESKRLTDPATGEIPQGIRKKELAYAQTLPKTAEANRGQYEWNSIGPFNQGGRTRALAIDILDESTMIAGSISGGIWRTTNGGTTWGKVTSPNQNVGASCIAQDTRTGKESTWYVGSGERYNSANGGGALYLGTGVWKSTDNGQTWDTLTSTGSDTPQAYEDWDKIWSIVLSKEDTADIVYVATPSKIHKSWDGGETWSDVLVSSGAGGYSYSNLMITPNGVLYATFSTDGSGGIWRSEDGDNWTNVKTSAWVGGNTRMVSAFDPSDENVVYFLANTPGYGKETFNFRGDGEWNSLWKYTYITGTGAGVDGTWEDRSASLPIGPYGFDDFAAQGGYDLLISVKPDDPNTVIIGGTNLYRSTDAFASENNTTFIGGYKEDTALPDFKMYDNHHPDQHVTFFSSTDNNVMYSGNDGGVYRTDDVMADTVVWTSLNNGYLTTQFYTNAIDHGTEGSNVIIGGLQDNGTFFTNSSDPQADWEMSLSYDGAYCAIADGAGTYYMSIQLGRILKMELDANGLPTATRRIDPIGGANYDFINPLMLEPLDNDVLYVSGGNRLWRNDSLDYIALNGDWDSISQGWMELSGLTSGDISAYGPTYSGNKTLYIGTSSGRVYKLDSATVGDPTFNEIGSIGGYVSSISVDPRDDDKIMVVASNYNVHSVHYTENGGTDWWRISGNMEGRDYPAGLPQLYANGPYPSCRWGEIIPIGNDRSVYLLATSVGLYATNTLALGFDIDSDTTVWVQQGANTIGNAVCNMIDHRESDGFTAIATHGDGMFTGYITNSWGVTDITENENTSGFSVYPNPASNSITIEGRISSITSIYTLNGQLITTSSENIIDISKLAPGQYLLISGNEIEKLIKY